LIVSNESQQEASPISKQPISDLLFIDNRLLNPLNEMKKRFGSSIVEQIERENNPTAQAAFANMSAQRSIFPSEVFSKLISLFFFPLQSSCISSLTTTTTTTIHSNS
jgi:hypothetical protein